MSKASKRRPGGRNNRSSGKSVHGSPLITFEVGFDVREMLTPEFSLKVESDFNNGIAMLRLHALNEREIGFFMTVRDRAMAVLKMLHTIKLTERVGSRHEMTSSVVDAFIELHVCSIKVNDIIAQYVCEIRANEQLQEAVKNYCQAALLVGILTDCYVKSTR